MKGPITIILLLTMNMIVFGQHNIGLKVNGGFSRISNAISDGTLNVKFAPSGHAGFFYNMQLNSKSIIGSELLFVQIEGKEKIILDLTDINGNNVGISKADIYKHISYLSFPIYYGYKFNKLTVNIGFQASFLLSSSGRQKGQATYNGDIINWDNKYKKLNIENYDFGPRAGVLYDLNNKLSIEGTYYYGVNNISNIGLSNWKWRIQQATVGLRYSFLRTK